MRCRLSWMKGRLVGAAYLGFFTIACAPVAEEFMFRGMFYPFIKQLGFPRLAWFGVVLYLPPFI